MQDVFGSVEGIEPLFGKAVRDARQEFGWSQQKLADRLAGNGLKLDPTAITRIEKGQRSVRLAEAITIAAELGIDFNELIRSVENPAQVLSASRESADRAMNEARERLQAMVFEFNDIATMVEQDESIREALEHATEGQVRSSDEYLPWVASRIEGITKKMWIPLPVPDRERRKQLNELLHLVTMNLIVTPEDFDAATRELLSPQARSSKEADGASGEVSRESVALAASDDPDWQARQEAEAE